MTLLPSQNTELPNNNDRESVGPNPLHIAIIMDGNNRWAKARGLTSMRGHHVGAEAVRKTVKRAVEQGIGTLSLFAFSSENWKRPASEVNVLMELFLRALKREVKKLHSHDIRLTVIGNRQGLSQVIQKHIHRAEEMTAHNKGMHLIVAVNYGGQQDITNAVRKLAQQVAEGKLSPEDIDENRMCEAMRTYDVPPIDLCIRTSGEQRLSNFMLWQLAYAELYFSPVLWPDFDADTLDEALVNFARRQRRFGMTGQQIETQDV